MKYRLKRKAQEHPEMPPAKILRTEMKDVIKSFDETYINGKQAKGRRKAVPPRYQMSLWNHYVSTLAGWHCTNNVSKGWHNRFAMLVGKKHPDLYYLLREFQTEQADTEIVILELGLGLQVKIAPTKARIQKQEKIRHIVKGFQVHLDNRTELSYLKYFANRVRLY